MELISTLDKMSSYSSHPIEYQLHTENDFIKMNELIGKKIKIKFLNKRFCGSCKLEYPSLYRMGFCKNCFFTKPEAGESIIRPELSKAHENVADRDLAFEKSYQLQPHVVYLANSGGLKVGVTRANNTTTRWTDQGALEAILLAETSNRYEAGVIEVFLKDHVSDKTIWQKMLKNEYEPIDLVKEKYRLADVLSPELKVFVSKNDDVHKLDYPVSEYPVKVKSINLEKVPEFEGEFKGMRGQYLIFEGGVVLNIRSHSGYRVQISF
jgi:hypothetical protein